MDVQQTINAQKYLVGAIHDEVVSDSVDVAIYKSHVATVTTNI